MPNGHHGTREEWDALEAPLLALDGFLEEECRKRGFELEKNYHNWPHRSLRWRSKGKGNEELDRFIEIYREQDRERFTVNGCAWSDQDPKSGALTNRRVKYIRLEQGLEPPLLGTVGGKFEGYVQAVEGIGPEEL